MGRWRPAPRRRCGLTQVSPLVLPGPRKCCCWLRDVSLPSKPLHLLGFYSMPRLFLTVRDSWNHLRDPLAQNLGGHSAGELVRFFAHSRVSRTATDSRRTQREHVEEYHLPVEKMYCVFYVASTRKEDAAMLLSSEHGSSSQTDETPASRTDENLKEEAKSKTEQTY